MKTWSTARHRNVFTGSTGERRVKWVDTRHGVWMAGWLAGPVLRKEIRNPPWKPGTLELAWEGVTGFFYEIIIETLYSYLYCTEFYRVL
jgi:hypothetical protein